MTPRGIRNNNFGNIEDGAFAQGLPGYAGSDGRFALFDTPQAGMDAMGSLLTSYGKKGLTSPQAIVNRWAPASDGNDTAAYANFVAQRLGVAPTDQLDLNDPSVVGALSYAMAQHENGPAALDAAMKGGAVPTPQSSPPSAVAPSTLLPAVQQAQGPREHPQSFGNTLKGMGAALMSVYDPKGAAVLQAGMRDEDQPQNAFQVHVDPVSGRAVRVNARTGEVTGFAAQPPRPQKAGTVLPQTALKALTAETEHYAGTDFVSDEAAKIADDIRSGKLDLGLWKQWWAKGKNLAGLSDDQSQAFARWEQFRNLLANNQLLQAKGVQTEGDAYRAMQQFVAGFGAYDNRTAMDSLKNVVERSANEVKNRGSVFVKSYQGAYGADNPAIAPFAQQLEERQKHYDQLLSGFKPQEPAAGSPASAVEQRFPDGVHSVAPIVPEKAPAPVPNVLPKGVNSVQPIK